MSLLTDTIADARYRELERKWQRDDPRAYQRLCELRDVYPHIEFTTNQHQMDHLAFLKWLWRNGVDR